MRTIISALNPCRYRDSYTEIFVKVWFEELSDPVVVIATPFDCERHGKELWIRAMAGEFGPVHVIDENFPIPTSLICVGQPPVNAIAQAPQKPLLEYHGQS